MKFNEKMVGDVCKTLELKYPGRSCDFYRFGLAVEMLRVLISNEWVNQAIFPNDHPTKSKKTQEAIIFLKSKEIGFQFQERVYRLAQRLYDIQNITGLEMVIKKIINGDTYGGYAEIEAGSFFKRRNIDFDFIIPSGIKGHDFDIKISGSPAINCEVKHKIEATSLSKKILEKTLSLANEQVPNTEPALFFIKIPEEWIVNQALINVVERTMGTFFPRNKNVLGFILHWEERDKTNNGGFYWKYKYEKNPLCSLISKEITNKLEMKINLEDSIVLLIKKNIKGA